MLRQDDFTARLRIGRTKALAKTADRKPRSHPANLAHVCNFEALPPLDRDALMQATNLGEVWSIGRRIGEQLRAACLQTALDVARFDPAKVRRR